MVIVWGEVLWDQFPDGAELGGAPANVAWHLAGLGAQVELVTRVGADADGARARARLTEHGVGLALAQIDPARATGAVAVTVHAGDLGRERAGQPAEPTPRPAVHQAVDQAGHEGVATADVVAAGGGRARRHLEHQPGRVPGAAGGAARPAGVRWARVP